MSEAQSLPDTIEPKVKTIRECLDEACEKFIKYCRELGHICFKPCSYIECNCSKRC